MNIQAPGGWNDAEEQGNPVTSSPVLTVSALNSLARSAIEASLPLLWVGGEISNLTRAASGHWYFSLKDATAQVRCAMFRGRNQFIDFQPANGDQVEVRAVPTLYEARGEFQLQVEVMRRAGLGALFEAFAKLKLKLAAEGLFDEARKRPLPAFPRLLGIVTSTEAAALRDVLTTLHRRAPWLPAILYPTPVQGEGAGKKIAEAIRAASERKECDVLIVCRGGGSIEDLWAFNDESVARAIAACPVPVISGVGHETDFTIADFAADLRAPTPTAAAEQVCSSRDEWMQKLVTQQHRMARPLHRLLNSRSQQVDFISRRLVHPAQRLQLQQGTLQHLALRLHQSLSSTLQLKQLHAGTIYSRLQAARPAPLALEASLKNLQHSLTRALHRQLENSQAALNHLATHLAHLNPDAVLARGYSVVRNAQGKVIRSSSQIKLDETLDLRFQQGGAKACVIEKTPERNTAKKKTDMDYTLLKTIHLFTVAVTLSLFLLRGAWRLMDSPRLNQKWVRIAPHANDTILLASAIGLLIVGQLNPLEHGWVMAKILGLIAYIVLGTIALKRGKTPLQRNLAFIGALAIFAYMMAVAVSKQVWPL